MTAHAQTWNWADKKVLLQRLWVSAEKANSVADEHLRSFAFHLLEEKVTAQSANWDAVLASISSPTQSEAASGIASDNPHQVHMRRVAQETILEYGSETADIDKRRTALMGFLSRLSISDLQYLVGVVINQRQSRK